MMIKPSASGDSYTERIAAINRMMGENELSMQSQIQYWTRTRDDSQSKLDEVEAKIARIMGEDRDYVDADEETTREYSALARAERELRTLNLLAKEMLDKLQLCYTEDNVPNDPRESSSKLQYLRN